eukprot:TRINITY_DN43786_c0_g1_i1.p1 TRINITY_DN43786_c0_g1~~TRINITY_DN43786_c0_g1_i1.p1  ORF type:complete len:297 (+),score=65.63 TRINITY_DN43786_c0_g1_i1:102-992(+)
MKSLADLALLLLAAAASPSAEALKLNQSSAGQAVSGRGLFFLSYGADDPCERSRLAVESVASLPCRQRPKDDPKYCGLAILADNIGYDAVGSKCKDRFDKVTLVTKEQVYTCKMNVLDDLSAAKLCVRSLALAPFKQNIFMQMDAYIVGPSLENIFDVLDQGFDITAAMECCAHSRQSESLATGALAQGWEMQTGVLGFVMNDAVKDHALRSEKIFTEKVGPLEYASAEQSAETLALAKSSVRFYPLPPNFNLERDATLKFQAMLPHVVTHWHYSQLRVGKGAGLPAAEKKSSAGF